MGIYRYSYSIPGMDCPCEEQLIRLKLQGLPLEQINCDLTNRMLYIEAKDEWKHELSQRLEALNLGAKLLTEESINSDVMAASSSLRAERRALIYVLLINTLLFFAELCVGFWAESMGVVADSLDMLADALIYGLSLGAVGMAVVRQKQIARLSGYIQMLLALIGLIEVIRRFLYPEAEPHFLLMMGISCLALLGNIISLRLLSGLHSQGSHIKASVIFSANDVLINIGVIISAGLVYYFDSLYPDLAIGAITFILVFRGAKQILALSD